MENLLNYTEKCVDNIKNLFRLVAYLKKKGDLLNQLGPGQICKVHKDIIENCPQFRPILSAINTPTYKLAKFVYLF